MQSEGRARWRYGRILRLAPATRKAPHAPPLRAVLPAALGRLAALVTLKAQSNHLRPARRSLPLGELGGLRGLSLLDLRFNGKLHAGPSAVGAPPGHTN